AHLSTGPALRRGALDKGGTEAVGGVAVVRYGENPLEVIKRVKRKIEEIAPGLPKKRLDDGTVSQVTIVPFYDRTELIQETLGTLQTAISQQILVTIIVVLVMVMHLRSSILISSLLPLAVLMSFIAMRIVGVDSNIMSLSGIAIAIGTMVDMGVILSENMLKHLDEADPEESRLEVKGVFMSIGHIPNTGFLEGLGVRFDDDGYVIVTQGCQTGVPGLFAAGDLRDKTYRQAISAAGMGCMAALEAEHYIAALSD
ncbi:MAG: efflux RND transporter permease subunit, partial [Planctomycetota bacterium]